MVRRRSELDDGISNIPNSFKITGSYTVDDYLNLVQLTGTTAQTITIPPGLSNAEFRLYSSTSFSSLTNLEHTFSPGAGVNLNGANSPITLPANFSAGVIILTRVGQRDYLLTLANSGGGGSAGAAFDGALLSDETLQSFPNGTPTIAAWGIETYDTGTYHDTVTNPERLTVPSDGYYAVKSLISSTIAGTNASLSTRHFVNGTAAVGAGMSNSSFPTVAVGPMRVLTVSAPIILSANDFLTVECTYVGSAGITRTAVGVETYFSVQRLGDFVPP